MNLTDVAAASGAKQIPTTRLRKPRPTRDELCSHPAAHQDDAWLDARACAAAFGAGLTWWFKKVSAGEAPQPAIRAPKFTRWKASDVRAYKDRLVTDALAADTAAKVIAQSAGASAVRQAKRRAAAASQPQA